MIEGDFAKKRWYWPCSFLGFGIFFLGFSIYSCIKESEITIAAIDGLICGGAAISFSVLRMLYNRKAYLHIKNGVITAKYNWAKKISCKIADIDFVNRKHSSLTILLKNKKRYTIRGLVNAPVLCGAVRRSMVYAQTQSFTSLQKDLLRVKRSLTKQFILIGAGFTFLAASILLIVLYTGGKDFSEFSLREAVPVALIGIFDLSLSVCLFLTAGSCIKKRIVMESCQYRMRDLVLKTTDLPTGNMISVYKNLDSTARVILFGYPHSEDVYLTIEEMSRDFTLPHIYVSPVYDNREKVESFLASLIELTESCRKHLGADVS